MREKNTPYPEQFRQQMVELVKSGRQPKDLAAEFGCHEADLNVHAMCDETYGMSRIYARAKTGW